MNKDALRKFYESFLPVLGLSIDDHDFINSFFLDSEGNKEPMPMMVNNMGVIFPTDSVLREGKWNDRVGFHPISESVTRGISPMLVSMRTALRFKIFQAIFFIGSNLIRVTKESREGAIKNMPANLVEALGKLPKTVDAKTLSFFSKVIAADNEKERAVVKICIKRNGSILGTDYKRTTSVYFPIYEELVKAIDDKESEFWGITAARKSDLSVVKEILEIILPDIDDENRYSVGTFVNVAPYLDCFIRAGASVQDSLNGAMDLLGSYIPSNVRAAFHASTDWVEELSDNREMRNIIPPLKFNEGEITEEEQRERETSNIPERPTRTEKSTEIPDFSAKGSNHVKRASEVKAPSQGGGRRYVDNSLTDEERRDPVRAERRHSSSRDDDDYYDRDRDNRRDRGRGRDRDDRRDDRRDSRRDRDDRGRSRDRGRDRDDRDDRRGGSTWSSRSSRNRDDRDRDSRRGRR